MRIQQRLKNIYNPDWIINLDGYLLLNYPRLWVTKLHYVFYYGLLVNIVLFLLVWIAIKPHQLDEFITWIIPLVMFIELCVFIFWFLKQLQFNIEKEFGNTNYIANFLEIVFYLICTLIIISPSFFMTASAIHTVAHTVAIEKDTNCSQYALNEPKALYMIAANEEEKSQLQAIKNAIKQFESESEITDSELSFEILELELDRLKLERIQILNNPDEVQRLQLGRVERLTRIKGLEYVLNYSGKINEFCQDIKYFKNKTKRYGYNRLSYKVNFLLCILFSALGILFLISRKNSNWKTIGWIVICTILFLSIFAVANVLIDQLSINLYFINLKSWKIDGNNEKIVIVLLSFVSFVMLCQSIFLTFTKRYNYFAYISAVSLPIAIYSFIFIIGFFQGYYSRDLTRLLMISFIPYLFIYPLHKKNSGSRLVLT